MAKWTLTQNVLLFSALKSKKNEGSRWLREENSTGNRLSKIGTHLCFYGVDFFLFSWQFVLSELWMLFVPITSLWLACSRLSVSEDDQNSEQATSGISCERDLGVKRRGLESL